MSLYNRPHKLFMIRCNGEPVKGTFFQSKQDARDHRDELKEEHPSRQYTVSPGPDHKRYRGKQ